MGSRGSSSGMTRSSGGNNAPVEALGGQSINEYADGVANDIVEYERREGHDRDDAFNSAADVREYADEYGWDDEMSAHDGDVDWGSLTEAQHDRLENAVTRAVIRKLFR